MPGLRLFGQKRKSLISRPFVNRFDEEGKGFRAFPLIRYDFYDSLSEKDDKMSDSPNLTRTNPIFNSEDS